MISGIILVESFLNTIIKMSNEKWNLLILLLRFSTGFPLLLTLNSTYFHPTRPFLYFQPYHQSSLSRTIWTPCSLSVECSSSRPWDALLSFSYQFELISEPFLDTQFFKFTTFLPRTSQYVVLYLLIYLLSNFPYYVSLWKQVCYVTWLTHHCIPSS
jgi:hypothetical protein